MKNVIDGIEITTPIITLLHDWAPASKIDMSRPEMHAKSLGKVQDFLCRQISMIEPEEVAELSRCLSTLVTIKDDLTAMAEIWKGGEE